MFDSASDKISQILSNQKFTWKLKSDLLISKNQLIFFTYNNNKFELIDLETMSAFRIELPFQINSVLLASSDKWLIQNTLDEKFILQKTLTNSCPNILRKINETDFESNKLGSLLTCNNNNITSEKLNNISTQKIDSPNRIIVTDNTYASIITEFPDVNTSNEIFSFPRNQKVKSLIAPIITQHGHIIRIISSSNVPITVLDEGKLHSEGYAYIEIINPTKKEMFYISIPASLKMTSLTKWLYNNELVFYAVLTSNQDLITIDASGCIRLWKISLSYLENSLNDWEKIVGSIRKKLQITKNRYSGLDINSPKHGKVDSKNEPHVGGNTWAGGTGGRDTAGLGGKGGPYRLNSGHTIYQVSDTEKNAVHENIIKAAKEMGLLTFKQQLKDIKMSEYDHNMYSQYSNTVQREVQTLKVILKSLQAKINERQWYRHQTTGELDDTKLIESLTGEKTIYRRLAQREIEIGTPQLTKRLSLLVDVSGSMYRFNRYDGRLDREMEACIMVMEAFSGFENKLKYDIIGHSGDDYHILFVSHVQPPTNNKERLDVIKTMYVHSQFCTSGDHTLEGAQHAISTLAKENSNESIVVVLSDANFERYGIRPETFSKVLMSNTNVNAYAIFIGSLGDQAIRLTKEMPSGRAFICLDLKNIPRILQQIFAASLFNTSN